MKKVKTSSTENFHFYSHEKSLYIAWECFRNVKEHTVFSHKPNGTLARSNVSLSSSDINREFIFISHTFLIIRGIVQFRGLRLHDIPI